MFLLSKIPYLFLGCPSERAMVQAHIQKKGFFDVLRSAGVKNLYDGVRATLYRDVAFNLVLFVLQENTLKWYKRQPSNVVFQSHLHTGNKSPLQIMRAIVRDAGPRFLFKGLTPRLLAVPLYMSAFLTVNEKLHKLILGKIVAQ